MRQIWHSKSILSLYYLNIKINYFEIVKEFDHFIDLYNVFENGQETDWLSTWKNWCA